MVRVIITVTKKAENSVSDSELLLCITCATRSSCRLGGQLLQKLL